MADGSGYGLLAYEPPLSLWALVENFVPQHERDEIKNMLGESLVEQSLELHQEVNTLIEIWQDYRDETSENFHEKSLPEPPGVRDRLKQEIRFFVQSLREKAEEIGRNPEDILGSHKTEVLSYALRDPEHDSARNLSRPMTARSDGRETPMRLAPSSGRSSRASTMEGDLDIMNDKLNILKLDEVKAHLRETLEGEVSQLLKDIDFLQHCLEEEADFRCQSQMEREPTLTDLRTERSQLQKELLSTDKPPPKVSSIVRESPPHVNHRKLPITSQNKLKPRPPSTSASASSRSGPIRGSHQVNMQMNAGVIHSNAGDHKHSSSSDRLTVNHKLSSSQRAHSKSETTVNTPYVEHVTVRTQHVNSAPTAIHMMAPSSGQDKHFNGPLRPSPPTSAKTVNRPTSANRFRKMVLECRDTP